jgi:hypothetical protein
MEMPDLNDAANDRHGEEDRWDVGYFAPLAEALMIGGTPEIALLLVPRAGVDEWEAWEMAKEGAMATTSFADMLRQDLSLPWADPHELPTFRESAVRLLDDSNERPGQPEFDALYRLAELDVDSAIELSSALASRADRPAWVRARAVNLLGVLRVTSVAPVLLRQLDSAADPSLRASLLSALVEIDPSGGSVLLARAAREETESWVRKWSEGRLERLRSAE